MPPKYDDEDMPCKPFAIQVSLLILKMKKRISKVIAKMRNGRTNVPHSTSTK